MPEWPASAIERRAVDALIPYARNARKHSEEQVAQIAAAIVEWGWTNPILIDEGNGILCGHGRVLAARKLGLTEVPVIVARGWTEAQRRAYVLADNRLALGAGWDEALLKLELDALAGGFDLALIGFSETDLAALVSETPEERAPPPTQPEIVRQDTGSSTASSSSAATRRTSARRSSASSPSGTSRGWW